MLVDSEKMYELVARYDRRNSFYGKAIVFEKEDGLYLRSYETIVAKINGGKVIVYDTYSPTTLRHIKEFLKQNNFKAESKAQIERDYMTA